MSIDSNELAEIAVALRELGKSLEALQVSVRALQDALAKQGLSIENPNENGEAARG